MCSQSKLYHRPRVLRVFKIRSETPTVKVLFFKDSLCSKAQPGQFAMVWIPEVDEVPMSLTALNPRRDIGAIAVKKIGEATAALHKLKEGSLIGVRGPYGRGFRLKRGKVLVVAGGVGLAPLLPMIPGLDAPTVIVGAQTKRELLFISQLKAALPRSGKILITTEDGSRGETGLATDILEKLLYRSRNGRFRQIYACGPELMLQKILKVARKNKISAQLSLERYIKCGVGLCGSCMLGHYRVCRDGPVFSSRQLKGVSEIGVFTRGPSGVAKPFQRQNA